MTARIFLIALLITAIALIAANGASAQKPAASPGAVAADTKAVRSSPAYSEVILRKTELESELESLLLDFTEEYPKVKENRHSLAEMQKHIDALLAIKPADTSKLTLALGKLIVRRVELGSELWTLQQTLADGHPDVKRAKRKVEIYDRSIREILN